MREVLLITLLLLSGLWSVAQTDAASAPPQLYKMLVGTDHVYALDEKGQLHAWALNTLQKIAIDQDSTVHYSSIAKDSSNTVYLGTNLGDIVELDPTDFSTRLHLKLKKKYKVSEIFFNSDNEIFLIVPYAVYDPIRDNNWQRFKHQPNGMVTKKRFLFFFQRKVKRYFTMPQYAFMDSQDRIWMTRSYGEFGAEIQIFDTKKRKIITAPVDSLNVGLLFPKSVFEGTEQTIYITSGLQHFNNSGEIYSIKDNTASEIYASSDYEASKNGLFVGPGAYNSVEDKIYFATTNGFFRAPVPTEGKMEAPEFLFQPTLSTEQEPLAVGVSMTIKKIAFTADNRLLFLTSSNGIGLYDKNGLVMLREVYSQ